MIKASLGGFMLRMIIAFSIALSAFPCTTFFLKHPLHSVLGKSYDWHFKHGYILVNKRNVLKESLALKPGDKTTAWTSKFGSVTFNQYGHEFPNAGINEAGLSIEIMWLDETQYPAVDQRETINELQWVQYQLDNYSSVQDMIDHKEQFRISQVHGKVHFIVCDRGQSCSAFEMLSGKMKVTENISLLSNDTYAASETYLQKYLGFGGQDPIPTITNMSSEARYIKVAKRVAEFDSYKHTDIFEYGFTTLDQVKGPSAQWNVLYDIDREIIKFRTINWGKIRTIHWRNFDFTCGTPDQMLNILEPLDGDVTGLFTDYKEKNNREMIEISMKDIIPHLPPGTLDRIVKYPQSTVCQD
jgi:hypothetical protein